MRRLRDLDYDLWACSVLGHDAPALHVTRLRPDTDVDLGRDFDDGTRIGRCLRCNSWQQAVPDDARGRTIGDIEPLTIPKHGYALKTTIIMRLIALERTLHVLFFLALTVVLILLALNFDSIQSWLTELNSRLQDMLAGTRRAGAHGLIAKWIHEITSIKRGAVVGALLASAVMVALETIEAVGLWFEKRWVEYLTVVETSLLLPYEIYELTQKVDAIRIGALIFNVVIVAYIVWVKRLFGLRRLYPDPVDLPRDISPSHLEPQVV